MALLEADSIVAGYGDVEILHGVSIQVASDEIVTVIGPNGAGKSTLMKAIFGLITPWDGDVTFDGTQIAGKDAHSVARLGMGYVPQTNNVFPSLTIKENLQMGGYVLDDVSDSAYERVYDIFPILEERRSKRAASLSGGQRQMLAMGRALMSEPQMILVDEPSAGLAPDIVDLVFDKITEINAEGTAVLMVEQNARAALRQSHRGYVLEMGENRFDDDSEALLNNDEVVDLYLGGT